MRKARNATPSQCQLFPPQPFDLPVLANVSPRLIHLLVKLLRKAAEHNEGRLPSQDAGHE
jgi:hypothetical protein